MICCNASLVNADYVPGIEPGLSDVARLYILM